MFFLTISNVWSFSYFFVTLYIFFIFSFILYLIPIYNSFNNTKIITVNFNTFHYISNYTINFIINYFLLMLILLNFLWSSTIVSTWFGHIIFSNFQSKIIYLIIIFFFLIQYVINIFNYFTNREIFDFYITMLNILFWIIILFCSNSIFTTIFIIEVLSTLIFLLLVTSSFSSTFFYQNLNFNLHNYNNNSLPYMFLNAIIFYFWISLISSLNLFIFILFFFTKIPSFDWYLIEHIFYFFITHFNFKEQFSLGLVWFFFIFCIFLKCGLAPFYVWKPSFFKGLTWNILFFYITFFYFFLFLFFINFFTSYFYEIFFYYIYISLFLIIIGITVLIFILCETFYIKTFLAISSILNSLLVLLSLIIPHIVFIEI